MHFWSVWNHLIILNRYNNHSHIPSICRGLLNSYLQPDLQSSILNCPLHISAWRIHLQANVSMMYSPFLHPNSCISAPSLCHPKANICLPHPSLLKSMTTTLLQQLLEPENIGSFLSFFLKIHIQSIHP